MRRATLAVALLSTFLALPGCKKKAACDPADSDAVCKGFQQCLRSDTSVEVCRMAEKDANKISNGSQKPAPSPQP
jgi:hypothetical protein